MIKNNFIRIVFNAFDVNASSSPYSVGIPAVVSVSGFVDRIGHNLKLNGCDLNILGFVYGYDKPKIVGHESYWSVALNVPRNTLDPDDKSPATSPRISAQFQIILETESGEPKLQAAMIREALENPGLRFCGGLIDLVSGIKVGCVQSTEDLWSGFLIMDSTKDVSTHKASQINTTMLESMFIVCHMSHEDGMRRYPNTLGYFSLEDQPKIRETPYGQQLHCYVEPAVGVVKEVHTTRLKENEIDIHDALSAFVFRKHFDEKRGSLYLKQVA